MIAPLDLDSLAKMHRAVIKQEVATTVEVLGLGEAAVVRKVYRNLGRRWLLSFGRRSRARREFDNLLAVAEIGVPCTTALAWSDRQHFLCIDESTLVTRFLANSQSLKELLASLDRNRDAKVRHALATGMGRLLSALHRGGFLWCTPMPRNVLVLGEPIRAELAVCDTPAGIYFGRPIQQTCLARIDLFDAAFSPSRCADYSAPERLRWLLGYCDGDRRAVRRLWRTLARRTVFRHDVSRALAIAWHTHILLPLRRRRSKPQPTVP